MERYQEIERCIIKSYRSKLWAPFIRALKEYKLLKENDHVCVCISGGKDSMIMAKLFQELHRHSDFPFEVTYLVMNPGYNEDNLNKIIENAKIMNIPIVIENTDIFQAVDKIDNPCYLCARMRRGCLYTLAKKYNCNKIALGHHFDDVIETTLMGILYNGQFQTMMPKLKSRNFVGMEVIRPLYLIREKDIINFAKRNNLDFIRCACRFTKGVSDREFESKRKEVKELIKTLALTNDVVEQNIFKAPYNVNLDHVIGYKKDNKKVNFLDEYDDEIS